MDEPYFIRPGEGERIGRYGHRVGPGTFLSVPPNVEHGFRPASDGRVRVLNIHAPRVGFIDSLRG